MASGRRGQRLCDFGEKAKKRSRSACDRPINSVNGIYFNARSLLKFGAIDTLKWFASNNNISVICLTETWCSDNKITDAELSLGGKFQVFRKDRITRGGGVCILISVYIKATEVSIEGESEIVIADLELKRTKVRIMTCYLPPSCTADDTQVLCDCLEEKISLECGNIIIGDFNMPGLYVEGDEAPHAQGRKENVFLNFVVENSLVQHIEKVTRKASGHILDLCLTSDEQIFEDDPIVIPPPFATDHEAISFKLLPSHTVTRVAKRNFKDADYEAICFNLDSTNWAMFYSTCSNVEEMYSRFVEFLRMLIDLFVPWTLPGPSNRLDRHIHDLQKKVETFEDDDSAADLARSKLRKAVWRKRVKEENGIADSQCVRQFFSYAQERLNYRDPLAALQRPDGSLTSDDNEMAEILRKHFADIYPSAEELAQRELVSFHYPSLSYVDRLDDVDLNPLAVYQELQRLSHRKSVTPEDIPEVFFKNTSRSVAAPLSMIFERSLMDGEVPTMFNKAIIAPLHKKGVKTKAENKRNVSMTSIPCKVMERIMVRAMMTHCETYNLISQSQFAYRTGRSAEIQLLHCVNEWAQFLNQGVRVDIVYTDLRSAFEVITHSKLMRILEAFGYGPRVLNWIKAFLSNRVFSVKVHQTLSEWTAVTAGSCQGTVLGPILFVHYINDIALRINSKFPKVRTMIYADDIKMYLPIQDPSDESLLQAAIDTFCEWSSERDLILAKNKCCVLAVGKKSAEPGYYRLDGSPLMKVTEMRDLGVVIDSSLKFSIHTKKVVKEASKLSFLIMRTFTIQDPAVYLRLFESLVVPKVIYGAAVYRPHLIGDWQSVEKIQSRFLARVAHRCGVEKRSLNMKTMNERFEEVENRFLRLILSSDHVENFFTISDSDRRQGRTFRPVAVARSSVLMGQFAWRVASRLKYSLVDLY